MLKQVIYLFMYNFLRNKILDMNLLIEEICLKMESNNPKVRSLLVSWLEILDLIPNVNILQCVPMLLPQLIIYVSDNDPEEKPKAKTEKQLEELLNEFKNLGDRREAEMDQQILQTLVKFYKRSAFNKCSECRKVSLEWTQSFLELLKIDITKGSKVSSGIKKLINSY